MLADAQLEQERSVEIEEDERHKDSSFTSMAAPVEIDFLGLQKGDASPRLRPPPISVRGIQGAMSKLDPRLLRTLLASGGPSGADEGCDANCFSRCPLLTPTRSATPASPLPPPALPAMEIRQQLPSPLPLMTRASASAVGIPTGAGGPMTIFYNGTVSVFDLPSDKAEAIINWVESTNPGVRQTVERAAGTLAGGSQQQQQQQRPALLLDKLGGDIPLARKKSLQRFLQKRKERLTAVLPCPGSSTSSSSCEWGVDSGEQGYGKRQRRKKFMA